MALPAAHFGLKNYMDKSNSYIVFSSAIAGLVIKMPAWVTDFSQNFDSTWNQEEVYGRVDPIATFQGTKRTISVSLTIPSGNLQEAVDHFNMCGDLPKLLYPGYLDIIGKGKLTPAEKKQKKALEAKQRTDPSRQNEAALEKIGQRLEGRVIAKPPLVKIKYANLIKSSKPGGGPLLGYITSLSWNPQIDMGYFTKDSKLFPKVINLSFTFSVLHQHSVGFTNKGKEMAGAFPF